jgi:hypothetical protein
MNSYNNMYINACDNECSKHDSIGSCKYFTSTANTSNTIPGTCKLYTSVTTPNYMKDQNLYFM